jgi:hypothetical protein
MLVRNGCDVVQNGWMLARNDWLLVQNCWVLVRNGMDAVTKWLGDKNIGLILTVRQKNLFDQCTVSILFGMKRSAAHAIPTCVDERRKEIGRGKFGIVFLVAGETYSTVHPESFQSFTV